MTRWEKEAVLAVLAQCGGGGGGGRGVHIPWLSCQMCSPQWSQHEAERKKVHEAVVQAAASDTKLATTGLALRTSEGLVT